MLGLLQPKLLLALLGLLLPLAIHLWQRRQGNPVLVGSIRWLEKAERQRISRLQFADFPRFLLRAALVSLLVVLLAQPVWRQAAAASGIKKKWVLVEPGYAQRAALQNMVDSLGKRKFEARWFLPGFPALTEIPLPDSSLSFFSLLRDIPRLEPTIDSVVVLARPLQHRLTGIRPKLPFAWQWIALPEEDERVFLAAAWQQKERIKILVGAANADRTSYTPYWLLPNEAARQILPDGQVIQLQSTGEKGRQVVLNEKERIPVTTLRPKKVRIFNDPAFLTDRRYCEAALRAVEHYTGFPVDLISQAPESTAPEEADLLIWLSAKTPPKGLSCIYFDSTRQDGSALFRRQGRHLILQKRLTEAETIESQLPAVLLEMLFQKEENQVRRQEIDLRQVTVAQLVSQWEGPPVENRKTTPEKNQATIFPWLWVVVLLLFMTERLMGRKG